MRTAKCPDNQGTPLLILANKQDLPNAKESKELEKLLGLVELLSPISLSVSSGTLSSIDGIEKSIASSSSTVTSKTSDQHHLKTWHIQPTCAITGEGKSVRLSITFLYLTSIIYISGLQEGLNNLYEMIIRKRKMQKNKKKR